MDGRIFLDTNILVYATDMDSTGHAAAATLLTSMNTEQLKPCISLQILCEFYATVTNPRKFRRPLTPTEASDAINSYRESDISLLYLKDSTIKLTLDMAIRHKINGTEIFDTQIVATMLENGVGTIYTANVSDFKKYSGIIAVNPLI
jgi:predicted nucleic acid-binding protein